MRWQTAAAFALVLAACATVIPDIPRPVSFAVFGVVFVAVGVMAVLDEGTPLTVTARPGVFVGTLAVWAALGVGLVRSPTLDGFLRLGAFVVFTGAALFWLPTVIPRRAWYRATAIVAAAFAVLGVITVGTGAMGTLDNYQHTTLVGIHYIVPLSLFGNPNTLGIVGVLGGLAAGGIALSRHSGVTPTNRGGAAVLAAICVLAVVLSASRTSLLALAAGGGVLVVARATRPRLTAGVTLGGLAALVGVFVLAAIAGISFSGRFVLWAAAIDATVAHPLFGWGPGAGGATLASFLPADSRYAGLATHNSYLRLFFIGGVVGGVGYLCLCASVLRVALVRGEPTTLALVVAALVFFVFETGSVFGISPASFVFALAFGIAQQQDLRDEAPSIPARAPPVWQWDAGRALAAFRQ